VHHPPARREEADEVVERPVEVGQVHEHALGAHRIEAGVEREVGEVGLDPVEVGQRAAAAPAGHLQHLGVAVKAGDVRVRVLVGQARGLEADAAAGVEDARARPQVQHRAHRAVDRLHPRKAIGLLEEPDQRFGRGAARVAKALVEVGCRFGHRPTDCRNVDLKEA